MLLNKLQFLIKLVQIIIEKQWNLIVWNGVVDYERGRSFIIEKL